MVQIEAANANGPATAMCGINGYFVSSMGRKANRLCSVCNVALIIPAEFLFTLLIWMNA